MSKVPHFCTNLLSQHSAVCHTRGICTSFRIMCRYEKLQRWDDALKAYQRKLETTKPGSQAHAEALLGQCRCLAALAEWDQLFGLCQHEWKRIEPQTRREMAPIAAHAAWQMGDWQQMRQYTEIVKQSTANSSEAAFLSAVLNVKKAEYAAAAGMC